LIDPGAVGVHLAVPSMITMTVSGNRPGYLAETLDSWSRVRGLRERPFRFVVEPGSELDRCRTVIEEFARCGVARTVEVEVNAECRGVRANPHHALSTAFAGGAGFVVLCEEDIVVGDDVLECLDAVPDDPDVLGACAFSARPAPQPAEVLADTGFSAWVWGTWADRWERYLRDDWFSAARAPWDGAGAGWDFGVERIAAAAGLRFVGPLASRSDNIGRDGGVHALPEEFEESRAATFAPHRAPVAWRGATDPAELPATVGG
jgi:hypothetical protein